VIEAKSAARKQKRLIKREHRRIKKTARIERAVMKISQPAKPIPKKTAVKKIAAKQGKAMKILKKKTAKLAAKESKIVKRLLTAKLQVQNLKAQMKKGGPKAAAIVRKIRVVRRQILRIRGMRKRLDKKVLRQERRQAKVEATIALIKHPEASVALATQQNKLLETQIQETHVVITQIVTVITRILYIIRQRI
jgi:thiamine kinase-like enzyme